MADGFIEHPHSHVTLMAVDKEEPRNRLNQRRKTKYKSRGRFEHDFVAFCIAQVNCCGLRATGSYTPDGLEMPQRFRLLQINLFSVANRSSFAIRFWKSVKSDL